MQTLEEVLKLEEIAQKPLLIIYETIQPPPVQGESYETSNVTYSEVEAPSYLQPVDRIYIDLSTPDAAYQTTVNELAPYFTEFMSQKRYATNIPIYFNGTQTLDKNVLGQAEVQPDVFGRAHNSTITIDSQYFESLKETEQYDDATADAYFSGLLSHEWIHSFDEPNEDITRSLTREFFYWVRDNYTAEGSVAYKQMEQAAALGGAPLTSQERTQYTSNQPQYSILDYIA